ncbi:Gfo/Idh/MocA family protein [Jannaschia donghaensis]|uniref:4-carboxy-2-hydroxymuconate-6-semialdehyde dehydrogenase n=1 Tax=Jannaschia donghaensis TaxID=420998 RepID=A0A0M6YFH1_9RHOB|nr:Gfo/Idh/MocA family oxidoreductase [Jannaschia donghaensis]CTQ48519.1 4-carboxy-2-hydroxymuconate-6-semialdehyde dehydrogenase [Jannaschia donghaensis]
MKAALIGLGMVAETHVRALHDATGVTLSGVLSRDPARARAFADRVAPIIGSVPHVFDDLPALAASDVDFAILCTPPNARADIVPALARAGKPILMEKPVERTTDAATRIVELCEAAGVPLAIVFQHRMRQASRDLADLLSTGRLGPIAAVDIAVPWWRDQSYYDAPGRGTYARDGGGVLISQAIHTLDLALTYTGPVARVQAMARTTRLHAMEAEDFVTAGLDFASGAVGSLTASTASRPGDAESITLHCTQGSARLASGQLTLTWADGTTETLGDAAGTGGGADPMAFTHAWHRAVIEDFAAALRDDCPVACTGREALRVHALIDAIVRSSARGCAVEVRP